MSQSLVWFRRDLRLEDNPTWASAAAEGSRVHPLFVIDPSLWNRVTPRRRSLLAAALRRVDNELAERGGRLRVEHGRPEAIVPEVAADVGADVVHVSREITPFGMGRDKEVAARIPLAEHDCHYIHPPGSLLTGEGDPYRVFTPFYRTWADRPPPHFSTPRGASIADERGIGIPDIDIDSELSKMLEPARVLDSFLGSLHEYEDRRDFLDSDSTSRISVALKYGTAGPRAILAAARSAPPSGGRDQFIRQLAWRDFFGHVMAAWPDTIHSPLKRAPQIAWIDDPAGVEAWKAGRTGYPLVDAGMRQLLREGWLNGRVRMVVASFLVKHLLIDWRIGERHMRRFLIDADVAQNVGNWQWVAGTGADAAPFFRIMNPITQSRRFDPNGEYIRRWVPELGRLDSDQVHAPWELAASTLDHAGIELEVDYPAPIIDHAVARERALEANRRTRSGAQPPGS